MPVRPWMKWYPADWRADPKLRACEPLSRYVWVEMLGLMHEAEPYGHLVLSGRAMDYQSLSRLVGVDVGEVKRAVKELEDRGVFSRTDTGVIFSRRMVRDEERRKKLVENGAKGGHPKIERGSVPKEERVARKSFSAAQRLALYKRDAGKCHWCGVAVVLSCDGADVPLTFMHVDHLVPIRDGGTNEPENLVTSCRECNGARALELNDLGDTRLPNAVTQGVAAQSPESRIQIEETHTSDSEPRAPDSAGKVEGEFGEFWSVYPRKVDRGHALKAYRGTRKKVDAQTLLAAVRRFADEVAGKEARFIPHAATWLNGERWLEYAPQPAEAPELDPEERRRQADRDWFFRQAVEDFHHDAVWPRDVGPPPTDPDCRAPRWVLIRFGYEKAA